MGRILVHVPPGIIALVALQVYGIPRGTGWAILLGLAVPLIVADSYRVWCYHRSKRRPAAYRWFTDRAEPWLIRNLHLRESERSRWSSMATYSAGLAATYAICSDPVVLWAVLILAFGDPAARIVGKSAIRGRLGNGKSTAGFFAFCKASIAVVMVSNVLQIWWPMEITPSFIVIAAQCFGVFAGAVAELVLPFDNFTIPVVSGAVMEAILWLA
jgi:dolichol kinase